MSTLEKLFMHVFERRNCILDQFKSQKKSYDQCLASCLLINGINPPYWLHDAELAPQTADLKELKRELTTSTSLPHPSALPHIGANSVPSASELYDSLSRLQTSRSRQKALELRSHAKPKRNSCSHGETIPQKHTDRATRSSGSQKTDNVSEMPESKKHADTIDAAVLSGPGLHHLNFRCTDMSSDLVTFNDHGGATRSRGGQKIDNVSEMLESKKLADATDAAILSESGLSHLNFRCTNESSDLITFNDHGVGDCSQNTADISNEQSDCILEKETVIQNVVNNPTESADSSVDDRIPGGNREQVNLSTDDVGLDLLQGKCMLREEKTEALSVPSLQVDRGVHIFERNTEDGSITSTVPGIKVGTDSSEKAVAHEPRDASTPCILDATTLSQSDNVNTSPRGLWSSVDKKETEGKNFHYEDALHSYSSAFISGEDSATDFDTNLPELEGFCLSVSPEHEPPLIAGDGIGLDNLDFSSVTRNSEHVLEQLCRYANFSTPLPGTSLSAVKDVCYSLPTGMLEQMNVNSFLLENTTDAKESVSGEDVLVSDIVDGSDIELSGSLQRWPYSYTPPVGKVHLRHTSLDKNLSMNMELTCFRIDEDACINEEDEHLHAAVDPPGNTFSSRRNSSLKNSHPHVEILECKEEGKLQDRDSSASVNLDHNFQGRQERAKKLENGSGPTHKCNVGKENRGFMIDDSAVDHSRGSLLKKPRKPKYPPKRSEDNHSHGSVDKVRRITNTMSNVTSFVPLVQKKQKPPQVMTGKRDVKVRALEAAEAAKRLEVDRENARKMRKEAAAAKVEKNKLAQAHLRRQEIEQRKKGENKKKEASLVKRKRQREHEERKEKERKRRCLGEVRKQQQECKRKLCYEKADREIRQRASEDKHKQIVEDEKKQQKLDSGREVTSGLETDASKFIHLNIKQWTASCESSSVLEEPDYLEAAVSNLVNLHTLNSDDLLLIDGRSEPQSYELSPYQPSEDEGDEEKEDELRKKKYIPQWAREKCVNATLELFRDDDPNAIFLPERSFVISEIDLG